MEKTNKFYVIYDSLMKEYGPQGWWPLLKRGTGECRCVYIPGNSTRALDWDERFEICAGAILTQNTNWTNAERALISLVKAGALKPEILTEMDEADIAELVRPSGYFNQKAKKLKAFSSFFLKKPLPHRDLFLSQWGLGPETVDDMLLYAFNVPVFVIDLYTKRLFARLDLCDGNISYANMQQMVMENIDEDILLYKEYHALIVRHAKEHCRKKPACAGCPLSELCVFEKPNQDSEPD